jgi:light-regulated signal transduction histidine kinase (bacteriophytochrome)
MVKRNKSDELIIANKELFFQKKEKGKRASELIIANKELVFQNKEKEKRAAELIIANKELAFQNAEKEKRASELIIANKELVFQNKEKEKRAAELIIANKELAFQNAEKEKRASEFKKLNKTLQEHAKELAISNQELEQFAYVASHDLQEPLRMVTSFLTQIEKKYGDTIGDKGKQYIHFAVDGAKRMRHIILDLLEFSKVGRLEEKAEKVDLNEVIKEIISLYKKQIEETQAIIHFDNLPSLQTNKTPFRQVFQNLLSNALKYHKKGAAPLIIVSSKETSADWQFEVKDNGIGINPEYFEKIFIIFQQLHNKDQYPGTGMGLAICKKIVQNLGGKMWVESNENSGSIFYFTIPKNNNTTL